MKSVSIKITKAQVDSVRFRGNISAKFLYSLLGTAKRGPNNGVHASRTYRKFKGGSDKVQGGARIQDTDPMRAMRVTAGLDRCQRFREKPMRMPTSGSKKPVAGTWIYDE